MQAPTGTVTLVFTDIEGSTPLWERHGPLFHEALSRHNALLRAAAADCGGYEVKTEGDAFFLAFALPLRALQFALRVQRELPGISLPGGDAVRVRIGLHTGEPLVELDRNGRADYFGPAVNRAARIAAAGHGGQTLLSHAVYSGVKELAADCLLTPLGEHRLKGLGEPEKLYQATPAGAATAIFPPLRAQQDAPTNLPAQASSFVGRGRELRALRAMLLGERANRPEGPRPLDSLAREPGVPDTNQVTRDVLHRDRGARLITLTGPGGCGKTRLAVALGAEVLPEFKDGVWFVDLAEAKDEAGLCEAVVGALRQELRPGRGSPAQRAAWVLEDRDTLLVLDTFEHLAACAPALTLWLRTAPRLKLVVTSRELLRVEDEVEFAVTPLPAPENADVGHSTARLTARLSTYPAIQLFLERAAQARPGFALSPRNAAAVADICRSLDGIPLALELAAARLRVLTPEQLAARLAQGIDLLASRDRDRKGRQGTLSDTIEWSYSLLDPWERAVLLQLAVFQGPFTLESAEQVVQLDAPPPGAGDSPPEVMEAVFSLRDKNLLSLKSEDDRYLLEMLGTIRAFCRARMEQTLGQAAMRELHMRHGRHYMERTNALAKLLASPMGGALKESDAWGITDALAAAGWCISSAMPEQALKLSLPLCQVLQHRNRFRELRDHGEAMLAALEQAGLLARLKSDDPESLARLQIAVAIGHQRCFDQQKAAEHAAPALELARAAGNLGLEAETHNVLGVCHLYTRRFPEAENCVRQSMECYRRNDDLRGEAGALSNLAIVLHGLERFEEMRQAAQQAYNICEKLRYKRGMVRSGTALGVAYENLNDYDRAMDLFEASVRTVRTIAQSVPIGASLGNKGSLLFRRLRFEEALPCLEEAADAMAAAGDLHNLMTATHALALLTACLRPGDEAVRLAERALELRRRLGDRRGELDSQGALALALHTAGRTSEAVVAAETMMRAALEFQDDAETSWAWLRIAACTTGARRAEALSAAENLDAGRLQDERARVLALLRLEDEPDPAARAAGRKAQLAPGYFHSHMPDVLWRASRG
ncbi:MAG: tetratricopeptide repeat protein [Planctomycetes bacterium]|nr:tetratricopeptide repeat protein [Planctomycetota bacterium]